MVCYRCKLAVESELKKINLHPLKVELGEVVLQEDSITNHQQQQLSVSLEQLGFELLDDKRKKIIEQIKTLIIQSIHYTKKLPAKNYSTFISESLHHDYSYLSKLFSETEGITIEQFVISQKIEKVKELLVYDELSLSEIADKLGYSSVAYLSNQFKKITGFTPSYYRSLKEQKRKNIEDL